MSGIVTDSLENRKRASRTCAREHCFRPGTWFTDDTSDATDWWCDEHATYVLSRCDDVEMHREDER